MSPGKQSFDICHFFKLYEDFAAVQKKPLKCRTAACISLEDAEGGASAKHKPELKGYLI
ncbi:MAG: hypothetical protein ACJAVM_000615 [Sulfitobacter sp.]|jgi:hypothetical protein